MQGADIFQFKGFHVVQGNSGLKVNTDAVILASWFNPSDEGSLLDVGCGTGVLSCILSKRYPKLKIDGIEIDENAQIASKQSFEQHPNANNLRLIKGDFRSFSPETPYDNLVCNPPYFSFHLNGDGSRNIARQQGSLDLKNLFQGINRVLSKTGKCAIVIPRGLKEECEFIGLQENLYLAEEMIFSGSPDKPFDRCILGFRRHYTPFSRTLLFMFNQDGSPTEKYLELVGDIYANTPKR